MARGGGLTVLRTRRRTVVLALIAVGLVGAAVILGAQLRPSLLVYAPVTVQQARVGTTYAVDEQVCLSASAGGAVVRAVRGGGERGGLVTDLVRAPDDAPPVIAFPVDPRDSRPLDGAQVPAGDVLCPRLQLRGQRLGELAPPPLQVVLGYGPGGLFRRTLTVRPPTVLQVTGTGRDPRTTG